MLDDAFEQIIELFLSIFNFMLHSYTFKNKQELDTPPRGAKWNFVKQEFEVSLARQLDLLFQISLFYL